MKEGFVFVRQMRGYPSHFGSKDGHLDALPRGIEIMFGGQWDISGLASVRFSILLPAPFA